jgi:hypothetical protein
MDWVVVLLPTALALRTFSATASLLALVLLSFAALVRRTQRRSIQGGPFLLLVASVGIVLTRPEPTSQLVFFILVALLVIRLVMTVDARAIIASLIDGAGVYLVVNVLAYYVLGLRAARAADRIGDFVQSSGFVRTIFPLSWSLEVAPEIASVYVGAATFLILERGGVRRAFRLACFVAAFIVLSQAGARTALFAAIALPVVIICLPPIIRWIAPTLTLLASVSALFLPSIVSSVQSIAIPFLSFISPSRDLRRGEITSLSNRDFIWTRSINYWTNRIHGTYEELLGFGQNGQYRSGASMTYAEALARTVRHPELATMHNSFLQQLFDGGLAGWLALTLAIFWASVRLSRRRRDWGNQGVAAIVAMVALLVNAMTQVTIAPGAPYEGFWLLVVLVGVSCQSPNREDVCPHEGHLATVECGTSPSANELAAQQPVHLERLAKGLNQPHSD